MDVAGLAGGSLTSVGEQVDIGVLGALQNLDKNVAAELFSSIGLGGTIDRYV